RIGRKSSGIRHTFPCAIHTIHFHSQSLACWPFLSRDSQLHLLNSSFLRLRRRSFSFSNRAASMLKRKANMSDRIWPSARLTRGGLSALLGAVATFPPRPQAPRALRNSTFRITSPFPPPRRIKNAQSHFVVRRPARLGHFRPGGGR